MFTEAKCVSRRYVDFFSSSTKKMHTELGEKRHIPHNGKSSYEQKDCFLDDVQNNFIGRKILDPENICEN